MKIVICAKQVPDTTEVHMTPEFTLQRDFVAQVINPADESALEAGLRLRDETGGEALIVTMGPRGAETMLRGALARGADGAVHMTDTAFAGADTLVTAKCLAAAIRRLGMPDLILCGRRAADGETGQVGPMLAALLGIPCVTNALEIKARQDGFDIRQLHEKGENLYHAPAPTLVTLCEWSYPLRLPTVAGLRKAAKADIRVLDRESLELPREACGITASPTRVIRVEAKSTGVRPCRKASPEEALRWLREGGLLS